MTSNEEIIREAAMAYLSLLIKDKESVLTRLDKLEKEIDLIKKALGIH